MLLSCQKVTKYFGEKEIVTDGSFGLEAHEKAALVGINGAGKSTLLKMITGQLSPDSGEISISRGITVGYLAQQEMLTGHQTIYEELRESKRDVIMMEEELRRIELAMKDSSGAELENLMSSYHRLQEDYERANGYALESELTGVLRGLGFDPSEFSKSTDTLSGGERTRVALGKLLLSSCDLILLDEPTNHLDIHSIAWLETYLQNYKGTVLIVSHDRYFLNKIVSKVIELENGRISVFTGDYNAYSVKKKALMNARVKAYLKNQDKIRHEEEVIAKLRQFNREKSIKRAESRQKMLGRVEKIDKPVQLQDSMHLTLTPRIESGNDVLYVEGLSCAFDQRTLFSDLSFLIRKGERVALIGDNGAGKTTLLKIITGNTNADAGTVRPGSHVHIGYYDQEHHVLDPEKTLFEEISDAYPDLDNTKIRSTLAAFLFTGDDVFKRVGELSGGEQGRLALAKLMLSESNFLILDEPTNHLDMVSKEILEGALTSYTGTVLYVSHDRFFINQTATRVLALENQQLTEYLGNYDYYLEKSQRSVDEVSGTLLKREASSSAVPSREAAAGTKEDWMMQKDQQARIRKRKNDLKKTEEKISSLEEEDKQIDLELAKEEVFTDLEKCMALTGRKAEIAAELETLYTLWEELAGDED